MSYRVRLRPSGRTDGTGGTAAALGRCTMSHPSSAQQRALKILAKSVYRELKASGYVRSDMISFTTELLGLVTSEMKQDNVESTALAAT